MLWPAVDVRKTGGHGKRIEHSQIQPVILDVIATLDITDLPAGKCKREIRKEVTMRLFKQVKKPQGILTEVDVAAITRFSPATILKNVKEHENKTGKLVPHRGTIRMPSFK